MISILFWICGSFSTQVTPITKGIQNHQGSTLQMKSLKTVRSSKFKQNKKVGQWEKEKLYSPSVQFIKPRYWDWRVWINRQKIFLCIFWPFHHGGRYHIETSPLICRADQWTGFYMITASVMKGLKTSQRPRA